VSDVELSRIAVIGSGSWGTTLANLLAEKEGVDVNLWAREEEVYKEIRDKHTNQLFFTGRATGSRAQTCLLL